MYKYEYRNLSESIVLRVPTSTKALLSASLMGQVQATI
jgi:hypothetical protein